MTTNTPCPICKGSGMTGWEKPMGNPPTMVFVPQACSCDAGRKLLSDQATPPPRPPVWEWSDADFAKYAEAKLMESGLDNRSKVTFQQVIGLMADFAKFAVGRD